MDSRERRPGQTESAESAERRAGAAAGTETTAETSGARFARKPIGLACTSMLAPRSHSASS